MADLKISSARGEVSISEKACEQFRVAWHERTGVELKPGFLINAIRASWFRTTRDLGYERRFQDGASAGGVPLRAYRDAQTNAVFLSPDGRRMTAVRVEKPTGLLLPRPDVGFVSVSAAAWEQFCRLYPEAAELHSSARRPSVRQLQDRMTESFARANALPFAPASRRETLVSLRSVSRYLDRDLRLRFSVDTETYEMVSVARH